jgi:predicted PhzF superfamily epimerase YddE/YHI9
MDRLQYEAKVAGNEVQLITHPTHTESNCNIKSFTLEDFLSQVGLDRSDVPSEPKKWPTFLNSSVARPKTLIPITTIQRLHAATPPQNPVKFRDMCDSIGSTGLYLYSSATTEIGTTPINDKVELEFECRQFPRFSGYSEDPATGIAAGALAASLHKRRILQDRNGSGESWCTCFQGTAMGRPSKILVEVGDYKKSDNEVDPSLKITYTGAVIFDSVSQARDCHEDFLVNR